MEGASPWSARADSKQAVAGEPLRLRAFLPRRRSRWWCAIRAQSRALECAMPPELLGERVTLRAPAPGDVEARLDLGRDPQIVRNLGGDPGAAGPLTREEVEAQQSRLIADDGWAIEFEGRFIGQIRVHGVVAADRRASLALAIWDPSLLGRGLGPEAIRLVAEYAFSVLSLHRLSARVLSYNTRSIRALEKCGFVREGVEREAAFGAGRWNDDVLLGLVAGRSEEAPA